jgi:hypothetical protein
VQARSYPFKSDRKILILPIAARSGLVSGNAEIILIRGQTAARVQPDDWTRFLVASYDSILHSGIT